MTTLKAPPRRRAPIRVQSTLHGPCALLLLLILGACSESNAPNDEMATQTSAGDAERREGSSFQTLDVSESTPSPEEEGVDTWSPLPEEEADTGTSNEGSESDSEPADRGDSSEEEASSPRVGSPCEANLSEPCYEGPSGTEGVGLCKSGTRSCVDGVWGLCEGQVKPGIEALAFGQELCTNGADEDCDGAIDEDIDADGDGYGSCSLDCCDAPDQGCGALAPHVSPDAFDIPNNGIDDDCDGAVDNEEASACSSEAITSNISADELVKAMDLCRFIEADGPGWGVLEASLSLADGSGAPQDIQLGISESFGGLIAPRANETMAVMGSGIARGVGEAGFEDSNTHNAGTKSAPPQSYMDVHGALQTAEGCATGSNTLRDSVRLRVRIKTPSNVHGLGFQFRFFSHEYPNYLCTKYNDFMLVLMEGASPALPEDGNISFDATGNPISVNNAFFTTCEAIECYESSVYPIQSGPDGDNDGCVDVLTCNNETNLCEGPFGACPDGVDDIAAFTSDLSYAGATSWLTTQVPIVPGEEITLSFHIWDTSDAALDSLVLLDSFQWIYQSGIGLSTHQ